MINRLPKVGDRVRVTDHSEAHGDEGVVYQIKRTFWFIELDSGCLWPICGFSECELIEESDDD